MKQKEITVFRGDRLKELRQEYKYSRARLADLLNIGSSNIPRYENGENSPSSEVVFRIAHLFGVSTDYLLGMTDEPHSQYETELTLQEQRIIHALRVGDKMGAVREIVNE